MKYISWVVLFGLLLISYAKADMVIAPTQSPTPLSISGKISYYASKYNVSEKVMRDVISCETAGTFDPSIQSFAMKNGVREDSWGLAQIHLPDHPEVSKTQAQNPDFALNFMASYFSEGKQSQWSCWKEYYQIQIKDI